MTYGFRAQDALPSALFVPILVTNFDVLLKVEAIGISTSIDCRLGILDAIFHRRGFSV